MSALLKNIEAMLPLQGRWLRYLLKVAGGCAAILLALLIPIVFLLTAEIPVHNWNLGRFRGALARLSHPPNTASVGVEQLVGNLGPTGNWCDYFVGEYRTYSGSQQAIQRFYQGQTTRNPLDGDSLEVSLVFLANGGLLPAEALPEVRYELHEWSLPKGARGKDVYLVYFFHQTDPGLDFRCY